MPGVGLQDPDARANGSRVGHPKCHDLNWKDALASLVDADYDHRSTRRLQELLRKARLKYPAATLKTLDYEPNRGQSKDLIRDLSNGRWIDQAHNVMISVRQELARVTWHAPWRDRRADPV